MSKALKKIKAIVGSVAPTIGAAIGGPWGGMAGRAISEALGVDVQDPAALEAVVNDPAEMVKLRQAELQFKQQMEELGVRLDEIYLADRQQARSAFQTDLRMHWVLTALIVLGFYGAIAVVFTSSLPSEDYIRDAAFMLLGALVAEYRGVMAFWFGSSKGSKDKSSTIDNAMRDRE